MAKVLYQGCFYFCPANVIQIAPTKVGDFAICYLDKKLRNSWEKHFSEQKIFWDFSLGLIFSNFIVQWKLFCLTLSHHFQAKIFVAQKKAKHPSFDRATNIYWSLSKNNLRNPAQVIMAHRYMLCTPTRMKCFVIVHYYF